MPSAELVGFLTERHRAQQVALGVAAADRLRAELFSLADLSDEARDRYVQRAALVTAAAQRRAATLAAGYARAVAPQLDRPATALELELDALVVTPETAWLTSPIIRARTELANGAEWAVALTVAASKARGYVTGDLAVAQRHGLERGARSTGRPVAGYRKVLAGGACAWCRSVADGVYARASSVPFHDRDACSVAPVFE